MVGQPCRNIEHAPNIFFNTKEIMIKIIVLTPTATCYSTLIYLNTTACAAFQASHTGAHLRRALCCTTAYTFCLCSSFEPIYVMLPVASETPKNHPNVLVLSAGNLRVLSACSTDRFKVCNVFISYLAFQICTNDRCKPYG